MVHQVEAETADLGMNGGAGRIPSGFCTLTCADYKWAQLHILLGRVTQWKALPPGSAREVAMSKGVL